MPSCSLCTQSLARRRCGGHGLRLGNGLQSSVIGALLVVWRACSQGLRHDQTVLTPHVNPQERPQSQALD